MSEGEKSNKPRRRGRGIDFFLPLPVFKKKRKKEKLTDETNRKCRVTQGNCSFSDIRKRRGKKERVGMLFHAAFVDSGEQLLLSESSHCLGLFFSAFSHRAGKKEQKRPHLLPYFSSREYPAIRVHAWREGGSTACGSLQRHFLPSSDGPEEE